MRPPISIGLDLIHLPRLQALFARRGTELFIRRVLSKREVDRVPAREESERVLRFLGVRWAAKEAAYKAFQPEVLRWKEVSVEKEESGEFLRMERGVGMSGGLMGVGQPFLRIEKDGMVRTASLSISHDGEYIAAVALAIHGNLTISTQTEDKVK